MAVVRGANAPLLQKTILEQLEAEKKVLAEGCERKVVRSTPRAANSVFLFPPPLILLELSVESFIKCLPLGALEGSGGSIGLGFKGFFKKLF